MESQVIDAPLDLRAQETKQELVVLGRTFACSDQSRAIMFLNARRVPYRFVDISRNPVAATRLLEWVGHMSVPTLVVAASGSLDPIAEPAPLDSARRIRGQNRGTLITEPSNQELERFLVQHGLL